MAISIGDLRIVLSGGAGNTDPNASLGGAISTAGSNKVKSQDTTALTTVTGVVIHDAMGNSEGVGTIKYDPGNGALQWKPFGGVTFDGVVISGNGYYTIGTTNGYLYVYVTASSLPGALLQESVTITNAANQAFDNISALESLNGDIEYRCFYITNTHATETAYDVRLWVKSQPLGSDTLDIALDPNGLNVTARGPLTTEQDPTSVLTGISWSRPSTYATALVVGTIAAGQSYAFWIKRVVPSNTTTQVAADVSALSLSALI